MDQIDREICKIIQKNAAISAAELGDEVGLSPSATQRRIQRLRSSGVIQSEVAILAQDAFDLKFTLIVEVTLAGDSNTEAEEFRRAMADCPNVQQCYFVTGEADYVVVYLARSMEEYDAFTKDAFFAKDYVHTFKTKVMISAVKKTLEIPI